MPKKRITSNKEIRRLAENLLSKGKNKDKIKDREDFDLAFLKYLGHNELTDDSIDRVWKAVQNKIQTKKAEKEVTAIQEEAIRLSKQEKVEQARRKARRKADLDVIAYVKEKRVYAGYETITRRKMKVKVLRDSRGRFARKA